MNELVTSYLNALQESDYKSLIDLFSNNAVVFSPLYGECEAASFYQELLADTQQSAISLLDVFTNPNGTRIAANFLYRWTLADGSVTTFDCVDIFELDETGKIKQLKIIYDTSKTKALFQDLKSPH